MTTQQAPHCAPPAQTAPPPAPPASVKAPDVSSFRLLGTLAVAGAAAGLLVVGVYRATLPTIERHEAAKVDVAVREVLRAPARWDTLYLQGGALVKTPAAGADRKALPHAFLGYDAAGRPTGAAVTAQEPGFQEEVLLMIGFEPATGTIIGYKVLDEKETPGLGDKIERDTAFGGQLRGRVAPLRGVKARTALARGDVQVITGATISSRAVIRIINHAIAQWQPLLVAYGKGGPS